MDNQDNSLMKGLGETPHSPLHGARFRGVTSLPPVTPYDCGGTPVASNASVISCLRWFFRMPPRKAEFQARKLEIAFLIILYEDTAPSCCIKLKLSHMPICSISLPSANRKKTLPDTATCFPVAGTPRNSPSCVPLKI